MNRLLIKKQAKASLKGKWGKSIAVCFLAGLLTAIIPGIFSGIGTMFSTTEKVDGVEKVTSTTPVGLIFFIIAFIAIIIVGPLFEYARVKVFLKNNRGEDFTVGNLFDGFKDSPAKNILTAIVRYCAIWLCYFIPAFIGGIFLGIAGGSARGISRVTSIFNAEDKAKEFIASVGPLILIAFIFFVAAIVIGIIATFMYQLVFYVRVDNPDMGIIQILKTSRKILHGRKIDFFVLQFTFIGWVILSVITFGIGFLWLVPYIEASTAAFYDAAKDNIIE